MALRLKIIVASFYFTVHNNIVPRTSLHDLPYRKTMKKCWRQVSRNRVVFSVAPADILGSNMFL